ncbi:MAG: ImmA/IrrE family metallo-endopeptidase [Terriglobia bacterium]
MNAVEKLAEVLVERLAINGVPDLVSIAGQIGLRIREVEADGLDGTLVRALDGPKGIIGVNSSIREHTRKRFTIGHEIGHYLIPHHRRLENVCRADNIERWHSGVAQAEREANEFSAELLLPRKLVAPRLRLGDPSLHRISQVANEFSTSLTATIYRFLELTDLVCCMVWSENSRARWYTHSERFRLPLPIPELPSSNSWAAKLFTGQKAPNDLVEVPSDVWLNRWDASRVRRVLEHSIPLPSYGAVVSFLEFELEPDENVDDEDRGLLEDLDANRYDSRLRRKPTQRMG